MRSPVTSLLTWMLMLMPLFAADCTAAGVVGSSVLMPPARLLVAVAFVMVDAVMTWVVLHGLVVAAVVLKCWVLLLLTSASDSPSLSLSSDRSGCFLGTLSRGGEEKVSVRRARFFLRGGDVALSASRRFRPGGDGLSGLRYVLAAGRRFGFTGVPRPASLLVLGSPVCPLSAAPRVLTLLARRPCPAVRSNDLGGVMSRLCWPPAVDVGARPALCSDTVCSVLYAASSLRSAVLPILFPGQYLSGTWPAVAT